MALRHLLWRVGNGNSIRTLCRKIWPEKRVTGFRSDVVSQVVLFRPRSIESAGGTLSLLYLRERHAIVGKIVVLFRSGRLAVSSRFNLRAQLQSFLESFH